MSAVRSARSDALRPHRLSALSSPRAPIVQVTDFCNDNATNKTLFIFRKTDLKIDTSTITILYQIGVYNFNAALSAGMPPGLSTVAFDNNVEIPPTTLYRNKLVTN